MKKTGFSFLMAALLALGGLKEAYALSITPGRTEVHLMPGQTTDMVFVVKNDHPEKLNIDVSVKNWFLYKANSAVNIEQWLKIHGKTSFTLKPGKERKVPVTISCPPKAEGVMVGMTSFTFRTEAPGMITPRISASIYLSVDGTQHAAGDIKQLAARIWQKTLTVGAEVRDTGNVHLRPSGTMTVLDDKGGEAALFRVSEGDPVYPGQIRSYSGIRQGEVKLLAPGHYVLKAHLMSGDVVMTSERAFQIFEGDKIQMAGEATPS
jgi:hypothetical protein